MKPYLTLAKVLPTLSIALKGYSQDASGQSGSVCEGRNRREAVFVFAPVHRLPSRGIYIVKYIVHSSKRCSLLSVMGTMAPKVVSQGVVSQGLEVSDVSDRDLYRRMWVPTFLIAGGGLTLAWIALLAYELIGLVEMALS